MTAQQLKNSILQMAIQGKLVPQDPNDESASVLVQEIRDEKEQMIKDGKIKKEKNPSYIFRGDDGLFYEKKGNKEPVCIEGEIPFEIPNSWEWVRFKEIIFLVSGTSYSKKDLSQSGIRILRGGNIQNEKLVFFDNDVFVPEIYYDDEKTIHKGDVLFVASTGSKAVIGKPAQALSDDHNVQIGAFLRIGRPIMEEMSDYVWLIFRSDYYRNHIRRLSVGTNINNIKAEYVEELLVPIPSISEQKRIISKVDKIDSLILFYKEIEDKLSDLNNKFPDRFKKSILQMAVQGKLVPQDPNDEPASALIERIHDEKEQLIKDGKIKRDKHESVIYKRNGSYYEKEDGEERCIDDEIPFEIPYSWEWVRLSQIIDVRDGTHDTPKYIDEGIPLVTSKNLVDGKIDFETAKTISQKDADEINVRSEVADGDILFAMIGTIGNPVLVKKDREFCIKNMALFKPISPDLFYMKYFLMFLQKEQDAVKKRASGGVQSFVSLRFLRNYLIPLPPTKEQYRIVDKVNQILRVVEDI